MLRLVLIGGLGALLLLAMRRSAGEVGEQAGTSPQASRRPGEADSANLRGGSIAGREQAARRLAAQLLFRLRKRGSRYTLSRDADVAEPVHRAGLTLDEVEETLENWKLRGFHGG